MGKLQESNYTTIAESEEHLHMLRKRDTQYKEDTINNSVISQSKNNASVQLLPSARSRFQLVQPRRNDNAHTIAKKLNQHLGLSNIETLMLGHCLH